MTNAELGATPPSHVVGTAEHQTAFAVLALGAMGVVFGDLGTSPLYALQDAFIGAHGMAPTYFLGRETVLSSARPGMARWRERLFGLLMRNARSAASFFQLPPNRVVELGAQVEI